ncbi:MAG: hypothetical protein AB1830_13030 [Pseudomonadota bacterium]
MREATEGLPPVWHTIRAEDCGLEELLRPDLAFVGARFVMPDGKEVKVRFPKATYDPWAVLERFVRYAKAQKDDGVQHDRR